MEDVEGVCAVCQRPARQRCAACREVFYCSRDHQKQDWTGGHKTRCRKKESYKVCEDDLVGRHLVANRDLGSGELVLREFPLVEAPSQFTPPVCVICYEQLQSSTAQPCGRCGWPTCGNPVCRDTLSSPESPHRPECEATKAAGHRINIAVFGQQHPNYQALAPLRCLWLREARPPAWSALQSLQSHCDKRKLTPRYEADRTTVGNFLLNYLKLKDKGLTEEDVLRVCGVLQVNGHEIPTSEPPHVALCAVASLLEHSCVPNCARRFVAAVGSKPATLEVRTLRAVRAGEHLAICYSDPLWGTASRRMQLQQTKFFECTCVRCADPRELGSMLSGVRCLAPVTPRCPGYMLPEAPLQPEPAWLCDSCQASVPHQQVECVLMRVGSELAALPAGDCEAAEGFVRRTAGPLLHPNHHYVTDARLALVQMWGHRCGPAGLGAEPDHVVAAKLKACQELRHIADIVAPGPTALRGLILMELQGAKAEDARRRLLCGELDAPSLRRELMESRRWLLEAVEILQLEAASPHDREQAMRATKSLAELDVFLQALPKS